MWLEQGLHQARAAFDEWVSASEALEIDQKERAEAAAEMVALGVTEEAPDWW